MKKAALLCLAVVFLAKSSFAQDAKDASKSKSPLAFEFQLDAGLMIKNHDFYNAELFSNGEKIANGNYLNRHLSLSFEKKRILFIMGGGMADWETDELAIGDLQIKDLSYHVALGYVFKPSHFAFKPYLGYQNVTSNVLIISNNASLPPNVNEFFSSNSTTNTLNLNYHNVFYGLKSTYSFDGANSDLAIFNKNMEIGFVVQFSIKIGNPEWKLDDEVVYKTTATDAINSFYIGFLLSMDLMSIN